MPIPYIFHQARNEVCSFRSIATSDDKELNVILGFADSSLTVPRSQGCRLVVMNGAAISFSSKKHTTTDDSTTAAALTESHLCAIIFQDNQAAIQISMNRGSLKTGLMLADLGTKALDPALFIFLRDQLCGYAQIMAKM